MCGGVQVRWAYPHAGSTVLNNEKISLKIMQIFIHRMKVILLIALLHLVRSGTL